MCMRFSRHKLFSVVIFLCGFATVFCLLVWWGVFLRSEKKYRMCTQVVPINESNSSILS